MNRKLEISLILFLFFAFILIPAFSPVEGQTTPYTVNGSVSGGGLDYYWISNVGQGDLFLLNVTGVEFELSYANLTVIETPSNVVQFIANTTSDLLLRIGPNKAGTAYTIGSTHQLSRQPMPYAAAGTVLGGDADFWRISNVTKGDLFLLIVNGDDFWDWESQLSYTNLSVIDTIGGTTLGAPSNANHIFQFYANTKSDLLLRISPPWPGDMTYTIQGTHFIPSHNVAVTSASTDKTAAAPGELINVLSNVINLGDYTESFNVTAYYGSKSIGVVSVNNITSHENRAISFQWNTTGVALGNYSISVKADTVNLEVATPDNTLNAGYISVRNPVTPTPTPTQTQPPTQTGTQTRAPTQTGGSFLTWLLNNPTIIVVIALVVMALVIGIGMIARIRNKGSTATLTSSPPLNSADKGTVICSVCGTQNSASDEFCIQCGARLKEEETRRY
jgi:hypothetical protein